jgi:alpha-mannosidase
MSEVHQKKFPWVPQVHTLYKNAKDVEIDFLVGPILINDDMGKEVVTQFTIYILSNKEFFRDSNGRYFLKRKTK